MKKQYRIINKGKGVLKITPSNLNEVEQPITALDALYEYVDTKDEEVLLNSKAYTNNSLITINTNITELEDKIALLELPNEILTRGAVVLVDNAIKILPYAFTVRINQKRLSNPLAYSVPINPTTIGYNRIDIITIDSFGIFTKLQGEESLSTAIKPQPLADTLEVTSINITGNVISPPVVTDTAKLDRGGYTGGSAMTLYQEITALDEAITTRIDDIVYEVVELSLPLKEDKNQKGVANGYVPLNEFTKIALQYLNVVNNLVDGGTNSLLTAEQGKQLQLQVSAIQNILFSDNVNLDTVQEIVDALENVQSYINTILVNDLTTGGTTKALTAEMGKLLQTNKVDKVTGKSLISDTEITRLATVTNQDISGKVDKVTGKSLIADSEITRLATLDNYTHPANHPPSIITQDANNRFTTDEEKTTWNAKQGALGFTPENVSNKQNSLAVDGTNNKYPTVTAVNTGLALKANLASPALTGTPTAPTPTTTTGIANKSYVDGLDNGNVKLTGQQAIAGDKTFTNNIVLNGGVLTFLGSSSLQTGNPSIYRIGNRLALNVAPGGKNVILDGNGIASSVTLNLQNSSGTLALTSNPTSLTATSFIKSASPTTNILLAGGGDIAQNTAFNKPFGITAGTVAEGNDSRILNGQTAFGWGNHAGLYPTLTGTGATGTWGINISGNATKWNGISYDGAFQDQPISYILSRDGFSDTYKRTSDASIKTWLGLGSNAYNSTAYLPLTGGTLTGALNGASATFSSSVTATSYTATSLPVFENNAAASSLAVGQFYRTSTGVLMVKF